MASPYGGGFPQAYPQASMPSNPMAPPQMPLRASSPMPASPMAITPTPNVFGANTPVSNISGDFYGLRYRIDHRDSNTLLVVNLASGLHMKARSGSMVAMDPSVQIRGELGGGFKNFVTGGQVAETIFSGPGEVMLAPEIWGDIVPIDLDGSTPWRLSRTAFLASSENVMRASKSQGLAKGLFSQEGFMVTEITGAGIMFVQALGAIIKKHLQPGEEWIVDNGHLVAWTARYKIERIKAGGMMSSAATEEGLVCRFTGPGAVYLQSRNPESLAKWIRAEVPAR